MGPYFLKDRRLRNMFTAILWPVICKTPTLRPRIIVIIEADTPVGCGAQFLGQNIWYALRSGERIRFEPV
jgi:hypothetical protein